MQANEKLLRAIQMYFFMRHRDLFVVEFSAPRAKKECDEVLGKRDTAGQHETTRLIADDKSLSLFSKRPKLALDSEVSSRTDAT